MVVPAVGIGSVLLNLIPWVIFIAFWVFIFNQLRLRNRERAELGEDSRWDSDRILDGIERLEIQVQAMSERLERLEEAGGLPGSHDPNRLPPSGEDENR